MKEKFLLSKSEYLLARSCLKKLQHKNSGRPGGEPSEFAEMLAEDGHIVGAGARQLYPRGRCIYDHGMSLSEGARQTEVELKEEETTLYEPVFVFNGAYAIPDIVVKKGKIIQLFEAKSSSFDSFEHEVQNEFLTKRGEIKADWDETLHDVAYQGRIIERLYSGYEVRGHLILPDKSKVAGKAGLLSAFKVEKLGDELDQDIDVAFVGDPASFNSDTTLSGVDITELARSLYFEVERETEDFLRHIQMGFSYLSDCKGKHCKHCQFLDPGKDGVSGYETCWGNEAYRPDHILDLHYGGSIKGEDGFLVDELIRHGKYSINDLPDDAFRGVRGERQRIQIEYTRKGEEWFSPNLPAVLESLTFPLHFMDFETTRQTTPPLAGMSPCEQLMFQFSIHSCLSLNSAPSHFAWIQEEEGNPNRDFAAALREGIGDTGTVFMWSHHEKTALREIARSLSASDPLRGWLEDLVKPGGRLVDQCKICADHYFHPGMKGRTSIKVTLPAVWEANSYLRNLSWVKETIGAYDGMTNPYEHLPPIDFAGDERVVKEGTGAILAYKEMFFGAGATDPEVRKKWKNLLLQYCKLDTLSMVLIFLHWAGVGRSEIQSGRGI